MGKFPTSFVEQVQILEPGTIGARGDAALVALREKGFLVGAGLTEFYAGALGVAGWQPHIREYCPRDTGPDRFATIESTAAWHEKGEGELAGRGPFLLLKPVSNKNKQPMGLKMAAYSWTGYEPCEELPDAPITSAYRVLEEFRGLHLSKAFIQVTVSATNALYAPGEVTGLETYESNDAAGIYPTTGFELVYRDPVAKPRPTLDPNAKDGMVDDYRLYMQYNQSLLAA